VPLLRRRPQAARQQFEMLRLRRLADKVGEERVARYHPVTGGRMLVKPETLEHPDFNYEKMTPEPYPLLGVDIEGNPPQFTSIATDLVSQGISEGWIQTAGGEVVHRSGGPPEDPWAKTHTFIHRDVLTFNFVSGPVSYHVIRQPDKVDGEVTWFYQLERI
jgi:hypothetical protein